MTMMMTDGCDDDADSALETLVTIALRYKLTFTIPYHTIIILAVGDFFWISLSLSLKTQSKD